MRNCALLGGVIQVLVYVPLGQCMELRSCRCSKCSTLRRLEWRWGGCELWLSSTPRYWLVCNWFPAPGGGLLVRTWPGIIQVSGSRVNAFYIISLSFIMWNLSGNSLLFSCHCCHCSVVLPLWLDPNLRQPWIWILPNDCGQL